MTLLVPNETQQKTTTVAVLGLGYVGLPTAIALARNGFRMLGIDISAPRLEMIRQGQADLLEHEQITLKKQLRSGDLKLADVSSLTEADVVLVCVPTPIDQDRRPDPRILRDACETLVSHARPGQTFILTSTAHVGSTRELLVEPLAERGLEVGRDVFVAFSPERIDPGVREHMTTLTPRVLGGYSDACADRAQQALHYTCLELHRVSSLEAAEMTKLYENTFRAVNIALAFEIADACSTYGLNVAEVTDAAATKPYAFMPHLASAGVGGHCIGVDPYYLLRPLEDSERPPMLISEAMELVSSRPYRVAEKILAALNNRSRVLIVGVSYKSGVADIREAPALKIMAALAQAGVEVSYFDPLIPALEIDQRVYEHVAHPDPADYDLTVITTVHPEVDYAWLDDCQEIFDCTYRVSTERTKHVL